MHEHRLLDGGAEYVLCQLRPKIDKKENKEKKTLTSSIQVTNPPFDDDGENHWERIRSKDWV